MADGKTRADQIGRLGSGRRSVLSEVVNGGSAAMVIPVPESS